MIFGSLFSGIGGFDLGFERAGMECKWQVEIDPYCRQVLTKHWPDVARYEDVRECGTHNLEAVDLVCGGFPCTDLSIAGKRAGLSGEQSGLFFEFARIARELRPAWLVIEQVPGLLSSNGGRDMGIVIGTLEDAGYMGAWRMLDSQWFGVAQRRRRVFIVCHSDARRAGAVLFEPESGAGHPASVRKAGADVAHSLDARSGGVSAKENQETLVSHALACEGYDASEDGTGRGTPLVAPTLTGETHATGTGDGDRGVPIIAPAIRCGGPQSGDREAIIGTSTDAHRGREVAGFPRQLDGRRYKALGNAVTVPVLEWLGRRIMKVENSERN